MLKGFGEKKLRKYINKFLLDFIVILIYIKNVFFFLIEKSILDL